MTPNPKLIFLEPNCFREDAPLLLPALAVLEAVDVVPLALPSLVVVEPAVVD